MKTSKKMEAEEAKQRLLTMVNPGKTIYCKLDHVSRSGMLRHISLYVALIDSKGEAYIQDISWLVAKVLDYKLADNGGIKVGGCGMDMGFALVYGLSAALFDRNPNREDEDAGYLVHKQWI